MIEDAPGWPIFWIPPVKARREDSRGKAGFAGYIEHTVAGCETGTEIILALHWLSPVECKISG